MPIDFTVARARMVEDQLVRRGIRDPRVLAAMRTVPRENFVEPGFEEAAYDDGPLPIGEGQTISQPFVVALMIEAAAVKPGDRVLEVGAGSGYTAAVISRIAGRVIAIERHQTLADAARRRLAALGYDTVEIIAGDGTLGRPDAAPFDAIVVSAGGPMIPDALRRQLAIGGRLVIPVGSSAGMTLEKLTRRGLDAYDDESLGAVMFVPLVAP